MSCPRCHRTSKKKDTKRHGSWCENCIGKSCCLSGCRNPRWKCPYCSSSRKLCSDHMKRQYCHICMCGNIDCRDKRQPDAVYCDKCEYNNLTKLLIRSDWPHGSIIRDYVISSGVLFSSLVGQYT